MIGIRNAFFVSADITVSASTTLVTTGLTAPIAVNQTMYVDCWVPFTVGATGGFKFQLLVPAGGTIFIASYIVEDVVTPAQIVSSVQTSSAAFANALAVAGTHWMKLFATVINGATAGNVDLQFACNSAANGITVKRGSFMDVWHT